MRQGRTRAGGDDGFKRHAFGSAQTRLMLKFSGHGKLSEAGTEKAKNVVEERTAKRGGLGHDLDFSSVLAHAKPGNQRFRQRRKKRAAQTRRQGGAQAIEFSDGGLLRVKGEMGEAGLRSSGALEGPENRGGGWSGIDDLNGCAGDLLHGLGAITPVCEESCRRRGDHQRGTGTSEAGEPANVRKMGDKDGRKS